MNFANAGQGGRPKFTKPFSLLIVIFGCLSGVAAQTDEASRPVARLVGTLVNERAATARPASSPTKVDNPATPTIPPSPAVTPSLTETNAKRGLPEKQALTPSACRTPEAEKLGLSSLTLINEARKQNGLPELLADETAAQIALSHSANMVGADFFSHKDPQGRDLLARSREGGLRGWRALGENIAYNQGYDQPAQAAVEGWLNSPSHRANIMHSMYTHTGIGVCVAPDGRAYFTQIFLAR
jgi:uncharacterized protein YkwD